MTRVENIDLKLDRSRPWYIIRSSDTGEIAGVDPADDSCRPYEPNDRCGGCGECLMMQAAHSGFDVEFLPAEHSEATKAAVEQALSTSQAKMAIERVMKELG